MLHGTDAACFSWLAGHTHAIVYRVKTARSLPYWTAPRRQQSLRTALVATASGMIVHILQHTCSGFMPREPETQRDLPLVLRHFLRNKIMVHKCLAQAYAVPGILMSLQMDGTGQKNRLVWGAAVFALKGNCTICSGSPAAEILV